MPLQPHEVSPGESPNIPCKNDVKLFEAHDIETGSFLRSMFTYFDTSDQVWIGENHHVRKRDLTLHDLSSGLRKVADAVAFPEAPHDITLVTREELATSFIKRPQAHCLLNQYEASLVPRILLDEVNILEQLMRNPHPNIVSYHGCVVNRGRITGIALDRLPKVLDHRFLYDASDFDEQVFERELRSAIEHIHRLGLAHNDLNPSNIGLNKQDHPVIIDWGSCKGFGEELLSAGTPGWIEDDFDISKKEHDSLAIEKLVEWVKTQKDEQAKHRPDAGAS
jgi:serine/threonine protein kinase